MEEEKYMDLVKEHIELDKILASTKPEYHQEIKKLLQAKKEIFKTNGLFADFKLNKINKKIEKFKNLSQK